MKNYLSLSFALGLLLAPAIHAQEPDFGGLEQGTNGSSADQRSTTSPVGGSTTDFGSPDKRPLSGLSGPPRTAAGILAILDPSAAAPAEDAMPDPADRRAPRAEDWKPPFVDAGGNFGAESARREAWNSAVSATHGLLANLRKALAYEFPNGLRDKAVDPRLLQRPEMTVMESKLEAAAWAVAARFQAVSKELAASKDPATQQKLLATLAAEMKQISAAASKLIETTVKPLETAPIAKRPPSAQLAEAKEKLLEQAKALAELAQRGTDKQGRTRDTGASEVGRTILTLTSDVPGLRLPKQGEPSSTTFGKGKSYRIVAVYRGPAGQVIGYELEDAAQKAGGLRMIYPIDAGRATVIGTAGRQFRFSPTFQPGPAPALLEGPGADRFEALVEECKTRAMATSSTPSVETAQALAESAARLQSFCHANKRELHGLAIGNLKAMMVKLLEVLGQVKRLTLAAHGQPDVGSGPAPAAGLGLEAAARKAAGFELGTAHNLLSLVVAMIGERERFDLATGGTTRTMRLGNFYSAGTNDKQAVLDADFVFSGPYGLLKLKSLATAGEKSKIQFAVTGLNYSAPPSAGGFQNGFAVYVLDTSHPNFSRLVGELSDARTFESGDRNGACHRPLANCPSFDKSLVLASKTRSLSEGGSAQAFASKGLSKAEVVLEFDVPPAAEGLYALYFEAGASSAWQTWVDYDEVRVDGIRAPNSRFIRPVDRDAFRLLIDSSTSMTTLFRQTASSLERQMRALGPSMQEMLAANATNKPLFLFSDRGIGPLGLAELLTRTPAGSTEVLTGLQLIQGGRGAPSYQPAKPWVLVILSDFCGTCFEKQNFGQALFSFDAAGKIGINRTAWPQLVEVHMIAVNDIVPGANRCAHPAWFREAFGPGSPPRQGRETTVYFSQPPDAAGLDRELANFLGQIQANIRIGEPQSVGR